MMVTRAGRLLAAAWAWLLCAAAVAHPLILPASQSGLSLTGHLWASPPGAAHASPQEALRAYRDGHFQPLPGNLGRGYGAEDVWLAFDLDLDSLVGDQAILEVGPAFLDHVSAYLGTGAGEPQPLGEAGDQVPRADAPLRSLKPTFLLTPQEAGVHTVLLRVSTTSTRAAIVTLYRLEGFLASASADNLAMGAVFTLALLLVLTALGLYLTQRNVVYLLWLGFVWTTTSLWFCLDGMAYRYLDFLDSPSINLVTGLLSAQSQAFMLLLLARIVDLQRISRALHLLLVSLGWLLLGATVVGALSGSAFIPGIVNLFNSPLLLVSFGIIVRQIVAGDRLARLYGPPLLVFGALLLYNLAANLGWAAYGWASLYGWQIAGFCNLLLLQWGFVDHIRRRSQSLEAERSDLLDMLSRQNLALEARVGERTRDLQDALAQVRRAETRQRKLLQMASHEFRTPAAIIKASLDSLAYLQDRIPAEVQQRLGNMRQASRRMIGLANDLIDQDRLQDRLADPALKARLDLAPLLQDVVAHYPHGGWLQLEPPPPCWIDADAALLKIALHNLILNAERHAQAEARGVTLRLRPAADQAHIEVCDHGPGIADADKPHIFERYYSRSAAPASGPDGVPGRSGLGLPIVQDIARSHGGDVALHDNPPAGSVFVLSLPLRTKTSAPHPAPLHA